MTYNNRRRHPRIYEPVQVNYYPGDEILSEYTRSLSMGGLYLVTARPLQVGCIFPLNFTLPDFNHAFEVRGRVIWRKFTEDQNGPPGMGVKFLNAREEDKKALLHYLAHTQITRKRY